MSSFTELDQIKEVAVLGAGQFGFAIAYLLATKNSHLPVKLYDPVKEYVESIQNTRRHPVFHPGCQLPETVTASSSLASVVSSSQLLVLAVPAQFLRQSVKEWGLLVQNDVITLNLAKALEKDTNRLLHDVVEEAWHEVGSPHKMYFAALAGGMIAEEVTTGVPIAADIACAIPEVATILQQLFTTPTFRIRTTTDVIGVELAGAFKNVLAIGAGLFDGLGLAVSSKSAFISMAASEFREIAIGLGATPESYGLGTHAWLGDLLTTCFGGSRNRLLGEMIGKGMTVSDALKELAAQRKIAEGYLTTRALQEVANKLGISAPLLNILTNILFADAPVKESVHLFFSAQ